MLCRELKTEANLQSRTVGCLMLKKLFSLTANASAFKLNNTVKIHFNLDMRHGVTPAKYAWADSYTGGSCLGHSEN